MAAPLNTPAPPVPRPVRPPLPKPWQWLMRVTGALALLLFLTPTVYVIKYYGVDRPREERHAALVSTARITPAVPVDAIAPPLPPPAPGNGADYYTRAIQAYADRVHAESAGPGIGADFPTPAEVGALLEGARRVDSRFFTEDAQGQPRFVFRDPDANFAAVPYRYPLTDREKYRYLSAAVGLARVTAHAAASAPTGDRHQIILGRALVRFGDALGREEATRTHLIAALLVKRMGLRLLLPFGEPALKKYVYSEVAYDKAVQEKYALLEPVTPDNLSLQVKVARHDADPMWRREAVWAIGDTLADSGLALRRPLESLTAKATLAEVAAHDPAPSVRAAAGATLGQIAQHGAVIQR